MSETNKIADLIWAVIALLAFITSLAACLLLFTAIGNDLIDEAQRMAMSLRRSGDSGVPTPAVSEVLRVFRGLIQGGN